MVCGRRSRRNQKQICTLVPSYTHVQHCKVLPPIEAGGNIWTHPGSRSVLARMERSCCTSLQVPRVYGKSCRSRDQQHTTVCVHWSMVLLVVEVSGSKCSFRSSDPIRSPRSYCIGHQLSPGQESRIYCCCISGQVDTHYVSNISHRLLQARCISNGGTCDLVRTVSLRHMAPI